MRFVHMTTNLENASMKNITVSIDEQTGHQARIKAAEMGASISALVRDYLKSLTAVTLETQVPGEDSETPLERRRRLLREVIADFEARGVGLRMSENLSRDEIHDRNALR